MAQQILKVCMGEAGLEAGTLWFESAGGREHSSFQYAETWLHHPRRFAIAPMLPLDADRRFFRARSDQGSSLPSPVADTTPDSWGRGIIRKDARLNKAQAEPLRELKTAIADPSQPQASIELLLDHAFYFEVERDDAVKIIRHMARVIAEKWQGLAREAGMSRAEVDEYRCAFEHSEAQYALRGAIMQAGNKTEPRSCDTPPIPR